MLPLLMIAGGIVNGGAAGPGAVSAYVVYRHRGGRTRVFKVRGPTDTARVEELPGDAEVDLGDLQNELHRDLEPVVRDLKKRGGEAGVSTPSERWVCDLVRAHLTATENADGHG